MQRVIATNFDFANGKKHLAAIKTLTSFMRYENKLTVFHVDQEKWLELEAYLHLAKIKFFEYKVDLDGNIGFRMVVKNLLNKFTIEDIKNDLEQHPKIIVIELYQIKNLPIYVINFAPTIDKLEIFQLEICGYTVCWEEFNKKYRVEKTPFIKPKGSAEGCAGTEKEKSAPKNNLDADEHVGIKMVVKKQALQKFTIEDIKSDLEKQPSVIVFDLYQVKNLPIYVINFAPTLDKLEISKLKILGFTVNWEEFNTNYRVEKTSLIKPNKPSQETKQKPETTRREEKDVDTDGSEGFKMVVKDLPDKLSVEDIKSDLEQHPNVTIIDLYQVKSLPIYIINFAPTVDKHAIFQLEICGYTVTWEEFNRNYRVEKTPYNKPTKQ